MPSHRARSTPRPLVTIPDARFLAAATLAACLPQAMVNPSRVVEIHRTVVEGAGRDAVQRLRPLIVPLRSSALWCQLDTCCLDEPQEGNSDVSYTIEKISRDGTFSSRDPPVTIFLGIEGSLPKFEPMPAHCLHSPVSLE